MNLRVLSLKVTWALAGIGFALFPFSLHAATDPNAGVEAAVRAAFADAPEMIAVAKCESGFREFSAPGVVLHGGGGGGYVGIFQIGQSLHAARAKAMGDDINTIAGNIAYAKYMYQTQGDTPWAQCIPKTTKASVPTTPAVASASVPITITLSLGMTNPQVQTLQQRLNKDGFPIASSGIGSPGQESTYFGILTRDAVEKFQCAKKIVCGGSANTTGYGSVGPKTRVAL